MPGVDPQHGDRGAAEAVDALEQRAVAAVADHKVGALRRADPLAVAVCGACGLGDLAVGGPLEAVAVDGGGQAEEPLGRPPVAGSGKK